jgi:hypothetical protein
MCTVSNWSSLPSCWLAYLIICTFMFVSLTLLDLACQFFLLCPVDVLLLPWAMLLQRFLLRTKMSLLKIFTSSLLHSLLHASMCTYHYQCCTFRNGASTNDTLFPLSRKQAPPQARRSPDVSERVCALGFSTRTVLLKWISNNYFLIWTKLNKKIII